MIQSRCHPAIPLVLVLVLVLGSGILTACDAVSPQSDPILVVEAFAETGETLPVVRLRQTLKMDGLYDAAAAAAEGALVRVILPEGSVSYEPVEGDRGLYRPTTSQTLDEGVPFAVEATWRSEHAVAAGSLPQRIRIVDVRATPAERPVQAVLLDSLQLDSLQTGARSGYVYPVEVSLWWDESNAGVRPDSLNWVRAQLKPFTALVPGVIELFFRSEQIMREDRVDLDGGRRKWTGVYLVPVDGEDDPLPEHSLKVALLRSDDDYARFASTRNAPDRREPVTNVEGGIGIVAGVSVDSLTLKIP